MREASFEEILHAACQQMTLRVRRGTSLASPKATRTILPSNWGTLNMKSRCTLLDKRHRLISYRDVRGTIDGATVHPREVVKEALSKRRRRHPRSPTSERIAEPSQADEFITTRLKEALALVDIRVLDHIIVAGGDTVSLAERGLV